MEFTNEQILEILQSSRKISEAAQKLQIKTEHRNGSYVIKDLEYYGNLVGFDINILRTIGNKKERHERDEREYLKNPRYCPICGNIIPFRKRNNKACSQSCAATIANIGRTQSEESRRKISLSLQGRTQDSKCSLYSDNPIKTLTNLVEHSEDIDTNKYDNIRFFETCKECRKVHHIH